MEINKRNRTDLKSYFVKNSIPTESNFAELIDGMLNQKDDGIVKLPDNPLSIQASGDNASLQKVINFYRNFADTNPAWMLNLNPRSDPNKPETAKAGFSISNGQGNSRLYIDPNSGNIGIGMIAPREKLDVNGNLNISGNGKFTSLTWSNNSRLSDDQGGSIELGGNESTAGGGTPFIDFHYSGKTQDYNTRIINDADRRLSVVGNLRVLASSNHLQLCRGATETTGDKQLFLELYQDDPNIQVPPVYPSIRFHHSNRFWHRLEARSDGFHFKEGYLPNDGYINISAGYIIGKNPFDRNFRDNESIPSDSARARDILTGRQDGTFIIGGPTPNYPYHLFFYWRAGGVFYRTWIPFDPTQVEKFY